MAKFCEFCDREVVEKLPEKAFTIMCGGKGCGHRTIYGLEDEDCRQVILNDLNAKPIINRRVASAASKVLRNPKSSKSAKVAAGSALTQRLTR